MVRAHIELPTNPFNVAFKPFCITYEGRGRKCAPAESESLERTGKCVDTEADITQAVR
jgi:hypothetical protein